MPVLGGGGGEGGGSRVEGISYIVNKNLLKIKKYTYLHYV